ncbi:diguanylate cyclase [Aliiglaciecola sp. NS0011-25]|uniref:sensor domain-containing diguanylate cyclase n=1 Tax=Aliiglaciecola sp. NS0011-25 TaxID=3127654 RepID=UPI003103BA0E
MNINKNSVGVHKTWFIGLIILFGLISILSISKLGSTNNYLLDINQGTLYLEDPMNSLTIEKLRKYQNSQWNQESSDFLVYGMSKTPYWFKFFLPNNLSENPKLIEIDYVMLDKVDIWFFSNGKLISEYHEGDSYPFNSRQIKNEKLLFPVPNSEKRISAIVKVQTSGTVKLPLRVWEEKEYLIYNGEQNLLLGLFFGFMLAMALSNLFFYVSTKKPSFLSYSLYVVSIALTLATLHGIGFKYIWPDWVWLQSRSVGIFATLTILFACICTRQLLEVYKHSRTLDQLLKYSVWWLLLSVFASLSIPYYYYIMYFLVILCFASILVFVVSLLMMLRGVKLARLYLLAWSVLLVSGVLAGLESANLLEIDLPAQYFVMLGAAIETFMLAFVLVISYSIQREEQYQSQELALLEERMAREAQEEALKLKEQAQQSLEYNVQERTLELEIALRELSETNNELEQQTRTDSLTGIRNRKHFDKKFQAEARRCRRERSDLSLIMLDIDHFKNINDTYGHVAGDEVIKNVANILKQNLKRTTDDACRYGGEEFALILPNTDFEGAKALAQRLREIIENTVTEVDELQLKVTISAGVASTIVSGVEDEKNLLESADKALYQAKRDGRNRVRSIHLHARDIV